MFNPFSIKNKFTLAFNAWQNALDWNSDEHSYRVHHVSASEFTIDLKEFEKKYLSVVVSDKKVEISAYDQENKKNFNYSYYFGEEYSDEVDAKFEDGVLHITLHLKLYNEVQIKKIAIR